jgi:1-acyl-sn-glycerol-3-phosphate acyltransferase
MISFLPSFIRAPLAAFLFALNTALGCLSLYPFAFLKLIVPHKGFQDLCTRIMVRIAELWISGNDLNIAFTQKIRWNIEGLEKLSRDKSYLVISNHQSWVDIVILQHVFNRKIPFIRFFLKHQLIYVPLLGWAWWALDFPFMKRHSKKFLELHPEKRNEDFESTKKACAHFKGKNVSVLNFLEGTRFTPAKRAAQNSPYKNLLMPKAGGLAFVLNAMGEQFDSLLDVTIYYPHGPVTFWQLFKGDLKEIFVNVEKTPIPPELLRGDYLENEEYRSKIQLWSKTLWEKKERHLLTYQ